MGQLADYALELDLGDAPLLVREFTDRFEVVLAGVELGGKTLALVQSSPEAATGVGGAVLGEAVGAALTRKADGAVLGATVGLLVAVMVNAYWQQRATAELT